MELSDKIQAVSRMQRYILRHLDEEITLDALADAAGYSKYHALRMFKELTGHTVFETIRALRLTKAAKTLQSSDEKVSDVALDNGFDPMTGRTWAWARSRKPERGRPYRYEEWTKKPDAARFSSLHEPQKI